MDDKNNKPKRIHRKKVQAEAVAVESEAPAVAVKEPEKVEEKKAEGPASVVKEPERVEAIKPKAEIPAAAGPETERVKRPLSDIFGFKRKAKMKTVPQADSETNKEEVKAGVTAPASSETQPTGVEVKAPGPATTAQSEINAPEKITRVVVPQEKTKNSTSGQAQSLKMSKKANRTRWLLWIAGAASITAGFLAFVLYLGNESLTFVGFAGLLGMGAGGYLVYRGFSQGAAEVINTERHVATRQVNSLDIYEHECLFEQVENPLGQPKRCKNDGKYYYVHIEEPKNNHILKPFELPDFQYYDPENFGQRVLTLPAHRQLLKRKIKMGQIVSGVILGVLIGVEVIIMVAMGG